MIHVIAAIQIKEGKVAEFIEIFKSNVPAVLEENGCIEYVPTVDIDSGIGIQELNATVVTILEKWDSVEALQAHLIAPHMVEYQAKVKDMVEKVSLKVLEAA